MQSSNPTHVLLIRHGETMLITNNRIRGQSDSPLSEIGIKAAKKTADHFTQEPPDFIYSSSLGGATETAVIIGCAVGIQPVPVDDLREQYYGWLEGFPDSLFEPEGGGYWFFRPFVRFAMAHTAEKPNDYQARVINAFTQIVSRHAGSQIMLIVHWGVLCILERYLSGKEVSQWFQKIAGITAVSRSLVLKTTNGK